MSQDYIIKPTLEENLTAFEQELPRVLTDHNGRFGVGNAVEGFTYWDTYSDASQYGNKEYKLFGFIIRQVSHIQKTESFTRNIAVRLASR